jgi:hypothetical protein
LVVLFATLCRHFGHDRCDRVSGTVRPAGFSSKILDPPLALLLLTPCWQEELHVNLCDSWFFALDQCRIGNGPESWLVNVTAVRAIGDHYWIQLEEALNPTRSIVLRVTPEATIDQVVATLMMTDRDHAADFVPVSHAA